MVGLSLKIERGGGFPDEAGWGGTGAATMSARRGGGGAKYFFGSETPTPKGAYGNTAF